MNLLLDSHVVLWCADEDEKLSAEARRAIADTDNMLFVSLASLWELYIKLRRGKLRSQVDLRDIVDQSDYTVLDITLDDAELSASLPFHHRDPFDRMLIAQALNRNMVFVSADAMIAPYNVPLLKAA
jgi:PIN domain nuclease of toxin-antitoxin system